MKITISEVLKGCTPGRMQSAGYMQVIPLISDMVDDRFGPFGKLLTSTSHYGTLCFENRSDSPTIFPLGAGVLTKQHAQNHASGRAKLMRANSEDSIDDAACIQESQGGTIGSGEHTMTILPYSIRNDAFEIKDQKEFGKLWPAIQEFNRSVGVRTMAHLEYYLEEFEKTLDEFIGQFEIVPNQVGAIIILNGQVAGIERAPNYEFWKELWKPLIRECYGSASLAFNKTGVKVSPPLGRMPVNDHKVKDLDSLEEQLNRADDYEWATVKDLIANFITQPFKVKQEEKDSTSGLCVETLTDGQFTGQIVRDSSFIMYASLMPDKNARFNTAANFSI